MLGMGVYTWPEWVAVLIWSCCGVIEAFCTKYVFQDVGLDEVHFGKAWGWDHLRKLMVRSWIDRSLLSIRDKVRELEDIMGSPILPIYSVSAYCASSKSSIYAYVGR